MKTIKFRRPHLKYEDNSFSHFSYWGVNLPLKDSVVEFTSPSVNNQCYHGKDQMFTGILDKNGKEIYEGDILGDSRGLYDVKVIRWSEEGADFNTPLKKYCEKWFEVFGNIYENIELL